MPDLDGLSMYQEERSEGYEVPTVFVTGCVDVRTAVRAMKDGALDLLEKPVDESVLLATIQAAMERSRVLRAERDDIASVWRRLDLLTPREAEICALVASGRLNKQIAALIGTTEKTVKVHRARVMAKLNVTSVAGLVRLVDRVLGSPPPGPIFDADHHARRRPRALAFMASRSPPHRHCASRLLPRRACRRGACIARPRMRRRSSSSRRAFVRTHGRRGSVDERLARRSVLRYDPPKNGTAPSHPGR